MTRPWKRIPIWERRGESSHASGRAGGSSTGYRGTGSPRRDGVTYVGALRGEDEAIANSQPELHQQVEVPEDGEWKKAPSKRRKQVTEPVREMKRREEARELSGFSRRSPPTLYTPEGPIQVCGQCLLPGHRAEECRRDVTCRRCGGVGHKEARCRAEHRDVSRLHKAAVAGKAHGKTNLTRRTGGVAPATIPTEKSQCTGGVAPATIPTKKVEEEEAPYAYDISLSLDSEMMRSKEDLRWFTVATVTSLREGNAGLSEISLGGTAEGARRPWGMDLKTVQRWTFLSHMLFTGGGQKFRKWWSSSPPAVLLDFRAMVAGHGSDGEDGG